MARIARNGCPVGPRASHLTSENTLSVQTSEPRIIISSIQKPETWNHRSRHSERLCPQPAKPIASIRDCDVASLGRPSARRKTANMSLVARKCRAECTRHARLFNTRLRLDDANPHDKAHQRENVRPNEKQTNLPKMHAEKNRAPQDGVETCCNQNRQPRAACHSANPGAPKHCASAPGRALKANSLVV
jgi:hypothetical protein